MINQVLGSPIAGGMGRLYLRTGGADPMIVAVIGPEAPCRVGAADDRFVWQGEQSGLAIRSASGCIRSRDVWFWRLDGRQPARRNCRATRCSFRISASENGAS